MTLVGGDGRRALGLQRRRPRRCSPPPACARSSSAPTSCSRRAPGASRDYLGISGAHRLPARGGRACRSLPHAHAAVRVRAARGDSRAAVRAFAPFAAEHLAAPCADAHRRAVIGIGSAPRRGHTVAPWPTPSSSSTARGWRRTAGSASPTFFSERGYATLTPEWPRKAGDVDALRASADELAGLGVAGDRRPLRRDHRRARPSRRSSSATPSAA